jgi:hypothetical protein
MHLRAYLFVVVAGLAACGKSDSSATPDGGGGDDVDAPVIDAPNPIATFSYTPGWEGVVSVDVLGAPQGSTDPWTTLASLTKNGGGNFTGTATLAPGMYDYVFDIKGDADSSKGDAEEVLAIDPAATAFELCPTTGPVPTGDPNPCALMTVPQGAAPAMFHVTGVIDVNAKAAKGFLVLVEREETGSDASHHFFANRVTTGSDGTYDISVAAGQYRVQVQHPQFEMKNDSQLDPTKLNIFRRNLTSSFAVSADTAVSTAEMGFPDYAKFAPVTSATLPTTFTFSTTSSRLEVYGTGNEIGDPWFNSALTTTGTMSFDGTFNTKKAKTPNVVIGTKYFWGLEQPQPADAAGVVWTSQTLAFPITWATGT